MKPWKTLARAEAPDGQVLTLAQRDQELVIKVGGQLLMSSRAHGSEEAMAAVLAAGSAARVLIGGLGCGYTLRATLDRLGPAGQVEVAELMAAVIEWNRGPLAPLAGHPLADARVHVFAGDVRARLVPDAAWDAVLLDVDNGPAALTTAGNQTLYARAGLAAAFAALAPGGQLVVWSAAPDTAFVARLRAVGFTAEARTVPVRGGGAGGGKHTLFVARRAR